MIDAEENLDILQDFSLIEFVHRGRKKKIAEIDIVPTNWLIIDRKKNKCVTKFMESPIEGEDVQLLHNLVETKADPPEDWPYFTVKVKGRARTFQEALNKLKRLEREDNVFTQESDEDSSMIQKKVERALKRKRLEDESTSLKLEVSSVATSYEDEWDKNQSTEADELNGSQVLFEMPIDNVSFKTKDKDDTNSQNVLQVSDGLTASVNLDLTTGNSSLSDKLSTVSILDKKNMTFQSDLTEENSKTNDNLTAVQVVDLANMILKSDFEIAVMMKLNHIEENLRLIQLHQEETSTFLVNKKLVHIGKAATDLENKYKVSLPIESMDKFEEFEVMLKGNKYLKNDVCEEIRNLIDKNNVISRSIVKILKRFLSKAIALQFTAVRKSITDKKNKFKPTELCRCIEAMIMIKRKSANMVTTDSDFNSALSDVLSNVRSWPDSQEILE